MSFCRITGKSRGLPKPNYFPLLQPISPADAKRFCKITGKSYGLPSHHYIPVLLRAARAKTSSSSLSSSSAGKRAGKRHGTAVAKSYGHRKHAIVADFRYVFPVFDADNAQQAALSEAMLASAGSREDDAAAAADRFVYRVDERKLNLVFPARLEAAVRSGDVCDVQLHKDNDSLLVRLRRGRQVTVELHDFDVAVQNGLMEGEGPSETVWAEQQRADAERKQRAGKRATLARVANIFEAKERREEVEEERREATDAHRREVKQQRELQTQHAMTTESDILLDVNANDHHQQQRNHVNFSRRDSVRGMLADCSQYCSGDWRDLIKPLIESWDWDAYEREAGAAELLPVVSEMPAACTLPSQQWAGSSSPHHIIDAVRLQQTTGGFAAIPCVGAMLLPADGAPNVTDEFIGAVQRIDRLSLQTTVDIASKLLHESQLPHLADIAGILQNIRTGRPTTTSDGVPGVTVQLSDDRSVFIVGQTVQLAAGACFVPGQTLRTSDGQQQFVPGMTLCNAPDAPDEVTLLPGVVIAPLTGVGQPSQFVAGQLAGDRFVCGQAMQFGSDDEDALRFVEGRTVCTGDGFGFVAGQTDARTKQFVPGQTIGDTFVPGQTFNSDSAADGSVSRPLRFVAGQNQQSAQTGDWTFVPGQTIDGRFVAGISVVRPEGAKFVAGQFVNDVFVPGITAPLADASKSAAFVPGLNVSTKDGAKFIHGQMVSSTHGHIFMPGTTDANVGFVIAQSVGAIHIDEPTGDQSAPVLDPTTLCPTPASLSVFGNMIQTDKGIEFYPANMQPDRLPAGKVIPGKLIKQPNAPAKFVPGIMENGGFIPGQVVWTDRGEQFIPGQVIETASDGLKFVPGQVIETKSGHSKFVPGQTMRTEPDGEVRFVPGQIVETRAGPTFIPGQVIGTEADGERFVPGQVVDTDDGPRFVPGRVVESPAGDRVTFIPGQMVATEQGPRFVAPDLSDVGGEQHFSVQSFQMNAEELSLVRPSHRWTTAAETADFASGELSIDARMLRQLSEAGMNIGRHIEASAVDVGLQCTQDRRHVQQFGGEVLPGLTAVGFDAAHAMFADLKTLVLRATATLVVDGGGGCDESAAVCGGESQAVHKHRDADNKVARNRRNNDDDGDNDDDDDRTQGVDTTIVDALVEAVLAVITTATPNTTNPLPSDIGGGSVYALIRHALAEKLAQGAHGGGVAADGDAAPLLAQLLNNANASDARVRVLDCVTERVTRTLRQQRNARQAEHIKASIADGGLPASTRMDNLCALLGDRPEIAQTLRYLADNDPAVLPRIVAQLLSSEVDLSGAADIASDAGNKCTVATVVIDAVRATANEHIAAVFADGVGSQVDELLRQSAALAKALGTSNAQHIDAGELRPEQLNTLLHDPAVRELIERVVVMRQLAARRPSLQLALHNLCADPFAARTDATLRDLLRQSGSVTIAASADPQLELRDSSAVPMSVLCSDNQLAVEDYLMRRSGPHRGRTRSSALVIVKDGLQAVVPRECSRDVLTGRCAYTVLDERGIHHFEPLNVLSALQIGGKSAGGSAVAAMARRRFAIYSCDMAADGVEIDRAHGIEPTGDGLSYGRRTATATAAATTTTAMAETSTLTTMTTVHDAVMKLMVTPATATAAPTVDTHPSTSASGDICSKHHRRCEDIDDTPQPAQGKCSDGIHCGSDDENDDDDDNVDGCGGADDDRCGSTSSNSTDILRRHRQLLINTAKVSVRE